MKQFVQESNILFWNFVHNYDINNSNIIRKVVHSFAVAEKSFEIACHLNLNEKDRFTAYIIGLFHDIGRFEQWKLYQTYNDHKSVDHGDLGFELLNNINLYSLNIVDEDINIIKSAIRNHTKLSIGENKKQILFTNILKNADTFANIVTTANGAQQIFVSEDGYTKEILDDFLHFIPLFKYSPKTKLDRCLMLTSGVYRLNIEYLKKQVLQHNYIDAIYETFSKYLNKEDKVIYKDAVENLKQHLNKPAN